MLNTSLNRACAAAFAAALSCAWAGGAGAAPQPAAPVARAMWIEKVKDGLYLIRGPQDVGCMSGCRPDQKGDGVLHEPGTTLARVTREGVILVDAKFAPNVPQILSLLRTVTDKPVKYLINSHHHRDHSGGDDLIVEQGAELIQQRDLKALYDAGQPKPRPAPLSFGDRFAFDLGGAKVEAYHFAPWGHTRGDTFVYFPDLKVVHMGDLVIDGMPHIDYPSGGSAMGFVDAIYQLLKLDFDVAIPGHGGPMTRDEVLRHVRRIETMNARTKAAIRRGVPLERIIPELGLEDLGWAHTLSTATVLVTDIPTYYAEMSALVAAEKALAAP